MADYTAESRFFTPDGLLRGSEATRRFFVRAFEEFAKPGMSFEMLRPFSATNRSPEGLLPSTRIA